MQPKVLMDDDCNQGKDDYSDIQYRALGARFVCVLSAHYNIIFLLE